MKYYLFALVAMVTLFFVADDAFALNQVSNWNMPNGSTMWNQQNGVDWATCGTNSTSTRTSWPTFKYVSSTYNSFMATTSVSGSTVGGNINELITIPGSGNQKVTGSFAYSANTLSGSTGWVRLNVYDATGAGTYRGTFGCATIAASSNVATTTLGTGSSITLTGGNTYRIAISMHGVTTSSGTKRVAIFVKNVVVNPSPTGVATSTPAANTTTSVLSWTTSAATSTGITLNTPPYKVYRGTASKGETYLNTAASNAYTDSAATGNTMYYYWISDVDSSTSNFESASSSEVVQLTQPDAPTITSITNMTGTTLTLNWNPPASGATTYKVYRCAGVGCTPSSAIATGVAGTSYNDSGLSAAVVYDYTVAGTNLTGDGVFSNIYSTLSSGSVTRTMQLFQGLRVQLLNGRVVIQQKT